MKSALPAVASLLAAVLLFTPTYGIGVAISPLTLIGSWIALSPLERASGPMRVGAALNLLLVVAGLSLLMVAWWPTGWFLFAVAWSLVVVIVLLSYTTLSPRGQGGRGLSPDR